MIPPCPMCHTNSRSVSCGDRRYLCHRCNGLYDDDPNEGGTCGRSPDSRLLREEAYQIRWQQARNRSLGRSTR